MSDYLVTDTELTSIADAIRTKGGTSADLSFPTEFVSAINAIKSGSDDVASGIWENPTNTATTTNIVSVADIGFTPKYFILLATNTSNATTVASIRLVGYFGVTTTNGVRYQIVRSTKGTLTNASSTGASFTYGSNSYLQLADGYVRFYATSGSIYLLKGTYAWMAIK